MQVMALSADAAANVALELNSVPNAPRQTRVLYQQPGAFGAVSTRRPLTECDNQRGSPRGAAEWSQRWSRGRSRLSWPPPPPLSPPPPPRTSPGQATDLSPRRTLPG